MAEKEQLTMAALQGAQHQVVEPSVAGNRESLATQVSSASTDTAAGKRKPRRVSADGYKRAADDWYVEPTFTVEALIAAHPFHGVILDPACGQGTIPAAFSRAGFRTIACDLRDRGYPGTIVSDFMDPRINTRVENIVCNPPYSIAVPFIQRARERATRDVAALLRLDFLATKTRMDLVNEASAIYIMAKRPNMPPGGSTVRAGGGRQDFCWIVWSRTRLLPMPLLRSIWPPEETPAPQER